MSLIGEYPSLDGYKADIKEMPIFKLRGKTATEGENEDGERGWRCNSWYRNAAAVNCDLIDACLTDPIGRMSGLE